LFKNERIDAEKCEACVANFQFSTFNFQFNNQSVSVAAGFTASTYLFDSCHDFLILVV